MDNDMMGHHAKCAEESAKKRRRSVTFAHTVEEIPLVFADLSNADDEPGIATPDAAISTRRRRRIRASTDALLDEEDRSALVPTGSEAVLDSVQSAASAGSTMSTLSPTRLLTPASAAQTQPCTPPAPRKNRPSQALSWPRTRTLNLTIGSYRALQMVQYSAVSSV